MGTPADMGLFSGRPGEQGKELARGHGWSEVAVDGQDTWLLRREGTPGHVTGALLRATTGGAPTEVVRGLLSPCGLLASGGRVYWTEATPAPVPGLEFIPTRGEIARLRCRDAGGQVTTLAEWPGSEPDPMAVYGPLTRTQVAASIVGLSGSFLIVQQRRLATTEFLRIPVAGGEASRLVIVEGSQQGALRGDTLYWTAPSEEAGGSALTQCVERLPVNAEAGAAPTLVAEWLPPMGSLCATPSAVYWGGDDLFRLPETLDSAKDVGPAGYATLFADGDRVVMVSNTGQPSVHPLTLP
jgi:hypothetical protein